MSDRLVVKDFWVNKATKGARAAKEYLDSSDAVSSGLAEVVGKAGRLNQVIKREESDWSIKRGKMSQSLEKLAEAVEACNKEFERLDKEMAEAQKGEEGKGDKRPDPQPSPGPKPSPAPPSEPAPSAPGGGGGGGGGSLPQPPVQPAPLPDQQPPAAPVPSPPAEPAPINPVEPAPINPDPPIDDDRSRQLGNLIFGFAQRWAQLTGQPVGKVLAAMGGIMGLSALLSLLGSLTSGPKAGGGTGADDKVIEGQPTDEVTKAIEELKVQGDLAVGEGLPPGDGLATPAVEPPIGDQPVPDVPELAPLGGGGGGGGSLDALPDLAAPETGLPVEGSEELPSLAADEPAASADTGELPSLETPQEPTPSRGASPMMMGGLAAAMGAASSSRSSGEAEIDLSDDRYLERQDADAVLSNDSVADPRGDE